VESECSLTFRPQETPLFSREEEVDLLFLVTVEETNFMYLQYLKSECNLSLSKRDFFVLLYYNTQSYWIRARFVSLSYF